MSDINQGLRAAVALLLLGGTSGAAQADSVTFDWVSTSGPSATGFVTLSSSLITSPRGFSVTPQDLTAAGQTAVGDISAFRVSFADGEVMSQAAAVFSNSTGWSDDAGGHLTSTWNASQTVVNSSGTPIGTLQVASVPYAALSAAQTELTSMGGTNDFGYWQIQATTVPLPAAFWLMASGLAGLITAARRRLA